MLAIFKEVLDYGQTKKAVCDARCPSGTDFVRIVPCSAGAAQYMFECVPAGSYERGEGLSRRPGVPSRRTCRSCNNRSLRQRLHLSNERKTRQITTRVVVAQVVACGRARAAVGSGHGS